MQQPINKRILKASIAFKAGIYKIVQNAAEPEIEPKACIIIIG
jgi:hypothetical protein